MSKTIYQSFIETVTACPDKTALIRKKGKRYFGISYSRLQKKIEAVAVNMKKLGIRKGDVVGIFSYNRVEWTVADLATLKLGGIVVPINHSLLAPSVEYILNDAKVKLLFVENQKLLAIVDTIRNKTPALEKVVVFDLPDDRPGCITFEALKKTTSERPMEDADVVSSDDVATIVYTSGTTDEPKGVVLTHGNIVSNALEAVNRFNVCREDSMFSYLPLSHMFERTCGCYAMLFGRGTIAYAKGPSRLIRDMAKVRPTLLLAVPAVIERAYDMVFKKIERGSLITRAFGRLFLRAFIHYANLKHKNKHIPFWLKVRCRLCSALVSLRSKKITGGKLRLIVSGGAPLNIEIARLLSILGFTIVEGYGLTETSPVVCCNTAEDNTPGTVGKPLTGVEVKSAPSGEILVRGPNVMKGYLNKPRQTAMALDSDGWFHTGDNGRFDDEGNLIITARIKEIIVTSNGKKIVPSYSESKISRSRYINQVMLYGDNKKHIVALVVPDRDFVEECAAFRRIPFDNYAQLLETDAIRKLIRKEIDEATRDLPSYEKVKAFSLLAEPFTVDNEMLAATLKLRRGAITKKYKDLIESLYA